MLLCGNRGANNALPEVRKRLLGSCLVVRARTARSKRHNGASVAMLIAGAMLSRIPVRRTWLVRLEIGERALFGALAYCPTSRPGRS